MKITTDFGTLNVPDNTSPGEAAQIRDRFIADRQRQYQLTGGGAVGSAGRFIAGMAQGELNPWEGMAQFGDLEKKLPAAAEAPLSRLREIEQTPAGNVGSWVGTVVNPINFFMPEWKFLESYGPAAVRGLGYLARQALRGGTAAEMQPVDERRGDFWGQKKKQGEWGAGGGAALGTLLRGPAGIAHLLGFEDAPSMVRSVESHIPGVSQLLAAGRSLSMPAFNRAWYRYVVEPIKGIVPPIAGHGGIKALDDQIGLKLDQATAGASFDVNAAGGMRAWNLQHQMAQKNLSGDAYNKFRGIVNSYVGTPLGLGSGTLNSKMFQKVTSDLQAEIRAIKPNSEDNRALRSELGEFRMWILDNAKYSSPQQKAAYDAARLAWRRFATGRDSVPVGSGTGLFTPDDLAKELDRRYPNQYTSGQAPGQNIVSAGQRAPFLPGMAAKNVATGSGGLLPLVEQLAPPISGSVTGRLQGEAQ